ncbi:hypothetical protein BOTBODRAFT_106708 [Botryobasidium botryosum FD-172 SS1]|uniref:NAD(P)-binding domain-containing protein n=1 Tax=Botryobasidium botryosum (strain FD-172 SS1) TaxID=930990 RepID=A0A067MM67_BOTB1|nr:hypothetical protein BOTBODRAFT_106708 [Botryobasidium botryosum FD-172 SS1]
MHLILTGATGTVGGPVLQRCLASPNVTKLSILSRRQFALPVGDNLDVAKAQIYVHEDYSTYPDELARKLQGADGCIWAQGVSQTEVSKEDYIRITYDYPLAAAKSFASLQPNNGKFNFVYVSGEGADPTEKTWTLFGRIKGRAEKALLELPSTPPYGVLRVYNVRPGFVYDPAPQRSRTLMKKIFVDCAIGPALRAFMPSQVSPTAQLSKVLVDLATGDGSPLPAGVGVEDGGRTLRCVGIRRLGDEL